MQEAPGRGRRGSARIKNQGRYGATEARRQIRNAADSLPSVTGATPFHSARFARIRDGLSVFSRCLDEEEFRAVQELLSTIQSAAGEALAVDRRPKLNDRLLH